MRERKYVKFRVDMLSDTKAKIIDRKPERDLIHYVWMALVLLAGKVNLYGELYISKNIPYTLETLAIELNRDMNQVKLALDTLIELEMMELTEENIYRVKNFVKHQNIKVKEKIEKKEVTNDKKQVSQDLKNEVRNNKSEETDGSDGKKLNGNVLNLKSINDEFNSSKATDESYNNIRNVENQKIEENIIPFESASCIFNSIKSADEEIKNKNATDIAKNPQEKPPATSEIQKDRKINKGRNKDKLKKNKKDKPYNIADEEGEDEPLLVFSEGERTLMEGEEAIAQWSF